MIEHRFTGVFRNFEELGHPILRREGARLHQRCEQNLEIHLVVREIHARGIVDCIRIQPNAHARCLDPCGLGQSEIAALADDARPQRIRIDAYGFVGPVPDVGVSLLARLHIGPDPSVPQQVDRGSQDRTHQLGACHLGLLDTQTLARLRRENDSFGRTGPHTAPFREQRGVVVGPAGTRQIEEPLAFLPGTPGIRIGIDEDVPVIEGSDEPGLLHQDQTVSEYVARHVADTGHRVAIMLWVDPELGEMVLDTFPRPARRNGVFLVVVADGSAGCEGVPQPEAPLQGQGVGGIGEMRCALVCRDHEIGIVTIATEHVRRWNHPTVAVDIVRQVEQPRDEDAVAGVRPLASLLGGEIHRAHDEASLGSDGDDQAVLQLLRPHQAEDLGPEIVETIAPADAASRDGSATDMDPVDTAAVYEDLTIRVRRLEHRDARGIDLDGDAVRTVRASEEIRTHRRQDQLEDGAEGAILVQAADPLTVLLERLAEIGFGILTGHTTRPGPQTCRVQIDQEPNRDRVVEQHLAYESPGESRLDLIEIFEIGPDQLHLPPPQAREEQERVQRVVGHRPLQRFAQPVLEALRDRIEILLVGAERQDPKGVDVGHLPIPGRDRRLPSVDHADSEMVDEGQQLGEQPLLPQIDAQDRRSRSRFPAIQGQRNLRLTRSVQGLEGLDVPHGIHGMGGDTKRVRKGLRIARCQLPSLGHSVPGNQCVGQLVLPASGEETHLRLEPLGEHSISVLAQCAEEIEKSRTFLQEGNTIVDISDPRVLAEECTDIGAQSLAIAITGKQNRRVERAAAGVRPQDHAGLFGPFDLHDLSDQGRVVVERGPEEELHRCGVEGRHECLVAVGSLRGPLHLQDLLQPLGQQRHLGAGCAQGRVRKETRDDVKARESTPLVELLDEDPVDPPRAVDTGLGPALADLDDAWIHQRMEEAGRDRGAPMRLPKAAARLTAPHPEPTPFSSHDLELALDLSRVVGARTHEHEMILDDPVQEPFDLGEALRPPFQMP